MIEHGLRIGLNQTDDLIYLHLVLFQHGLRNQRAAKRLTARRGSQIMASPCQEAQQRGRMLRNSPEGSDPDDSIRCYSP